MSTVWKGSAFECLHSKYEIVLLHSRYNSSNGNYSSAPCNDGSVRIVGQIVGVSENTYYTSQVIISDSASKSGLIGKTVECVRDNGSATEVVMSYIIITEILNFVNATSKYNVIMLILFHRYVVCVTFTPFAHYNIIL